MPESLLYQTPPEFLTPAEHADMVTDASRALLKITLDPDIQGYFRERHGEHVYSLHAAYPETSDERSDMIRQWAEATQKFNFVSKDGDELGGDYDKFRQLHLIILDNTQPNIVPACVITPHLPTPDPQNPGLVRLPLALKAVSSDPWHKDLLATIKATTSPDGNPLPDIASQEILRQTWDVSLVSLMPSHRYGNGELSHGKNFLGFLYNATLRAAAAEGIIRMVAALDDPILRGLRVYRKHWHPLEGIDPQPYGTRIKNSNKSTVATVDLSAWRSDMEDKWRAGADKLWGKYLEKENVQVVGLEA